MGIDGLDEVQDKLEAMQKNAEELDGENEIPLVELFPPEFMREFTDFESIKKFLEQVRGLLSLKMILRQFHRMKLMSMSTRIPCSITRKK